MDIAKLIDEYIQWLKNEITFERIGEFYEITTPFLDDANDYIQIYVRQDGDTISFSDDSAVINKYKAYGINFSGSRKNQLKRIMGQYGVQLNNNELTSRAPVNKFAQSKHMFIQAMIKAGDLLAGSKPRTTSFFLDDIQNFFAKEEIYYSDNVQFVGTSGFSHKYDFLLQRSKNRPERLCSAINNPTRSNVSNALFAWSDTRETRSEDSQLIVILNDHNGIARGTEEAFDNYEAKIIRWSDINSRENISLLSA